MPHWSPEEPGRSGARSWSGWREQGMRWQFTATARSNPGRTSRERSRRGEGGPSFRQADLADAAAVAGLMESAGQALGPVTLLVNNASEFQPDDVETLGEAQWDRHFAVNLRAPAFLSRDFARLLPDELAGSIVNIVDQRVLKLTPQFFSYTLTKAALFAATARPGARPRIRVNAVGPGPTPHQYPPGR